MSDPTQTPDDPFKPVPDDAGNGNPPKKPPVIVKG